MTDICVRNLKNKIKKKTACVSILALFNHGTVAAREAKICQEAHNLDISRLGWENWEESLQDPCELMDST